MAGFIVAGPQLTVSAIPGTAQSVLTTEQGPGNNGRLAGSFTITANAVVGGGSCHYAQFDHDRFVGHRQ
jgi:hypothetical protein